MKFKIEKKEIPTRTFKDGFQVEVHTSSLINGVYKFLFLENGTPVEYHPFTNSWGYYHNHYWPMLGNLVKVYDENGVIIRG